MTTREPSDSEPPEAGDVPSVLFLCVHNAGRSQMAAGWLADLAGDRVQVYSAGSGPAREVNPAAIAAMAEIGIDISGALPRPWTDTMARTADVVVSMGCGDACPVRPGARYVEWDIPDPAEQPLERVRAVREQIEGQVRSLLAELGVEARAR